MEKNQSRQRIIPLYRIGSRYCTAPWEEGGTQAQKISLLLMAGVTVGEGAGGEALVFSFQHTVGVGVNTAIALGLCSLAEHPPDVERQRGREYRAVEQEMLALRVSRLMSAIASAARTGDPLAKEVLGPSTSDTLRALTEHFEQLVE
jgi:hypothetical protein